MDKRYPGKHKTAPNDKLYGETELRQNAIMASKKPGMPRFGPSQI